MYDTERWRVEFRGGPLDGPVTATNSSDPIGVVAGVTVTLALEGGIGAAGELVAGGMFAAGYKYEVVSIDHAAKLAVFELRPYC